MSEIFILDCDYEREHMLDSCRAILDHFRVDASGKLVLLKPNMLGPWPPESHVCTHPSLVLSMRLALLERGASVLVGDNPGLAGYGAVERCARVSGIGEAARDSFINMSADPRRIEWDSKVTPHTILSATVFRADLVISLPKFKTHLGTTFTGAVKNSFGFVVGAEKARLHAYATGRDDFGEVLADVYETRLPDLAVMDAGIVMEGKGPSGGSLRRAGYLLTSDDAVALDAACCPFWPASRCPASSHGARWGARHSSWAFTSSRACASASTRQRATLAAYVRPSARRKPSRCEKDARISTGKPASAVTAATSSAASGPSSRGLSWDS